MFRQVFNTVVASFLATVLSIGIMLGFFKEQPRELRGNDVEQALWRGIPMEELRNIQVLVHRHNTS